MISLYGWRSHPIIVHQIITIITVQDKRTEELRRLPWNRRETVGEASMRIQRTWMAVVAAIILCVGGARAQEPVNLRDVVYAHKLGVALTMDVFKPAKPNGIGVIWMVSGGWVSNHDAINPGLAKRSEEHTSELQS